MDNGTLSIAIEGSENEVVAETRAGETKKINKIVFFSSIVGSRIYCAELWRGLATSVAASSMLTFWGF